MVDIKEFSKQDIYVIADIHGNFGVLMVNIKKYDLKNCIILICGDVGLGFYSREYYNETFETINNECIFRNIHLLMIRGNHDDPLYFNEKLIKFSNVETLNDYTILQVDNKNILCVGGAISIDRSVRKYTYENRLNYTLIQLLYDNPNAKLDDAKKLVYPSYWEYEPPIYDEGLLNFINDLGFNIDYVVTHTSPSFAFKNTKDGIEFWLKKDKELSKDLDKERKSLSLIYDFLIKNNNVIKKWVYGHFHDSNNEKINGTEFIALINADYSFQMCHLNKEDEVF